MTSLLFKMDWFQSKQKPDRLQWRRSGFEHINGPRWPQIENAARCGHRTGRWPGLRATSFPAQLWDTSQKQRHLWLCMNHVAPLLCSCERSWPTGKLSGPPLGEKHIFNARKEETESSSQNVHSGFLNIWAFFGKLGIKTSSTELMLYHQLDLFSNDLRFKICDTIEENSCWKSCGVFCSDQSIFPNLTTAWNKCN